MNYQAIRQLKTKNKVIGIFPTLQEAHDTIKKDGATFMEFSYFGGFPVYTDTVKKRVYSIQGQVKGLEIVCSLDKKELSAFNFTI